MRIPLTKYGWPQVVILPVILLVAMILFPTLMCGVLGVLPLTGWAVVSIEAILAVVLLWVLLFFRDPDRISPPDENILLAPADGKITDIDLFEENGFIGGAAIRIGIFLNIFNVHINRAPCKATVERITYRQGKYKNAMNPESGRVNESNELGLVRAEAPNDRLIVRQISGAIARRIVCEATEGQELTGGEKFGMIKFGSRTELYVPARENAKCLVKTGDKVKAGLTALVRYEQ